MDIIWERVQQTAPEIDENSDYGKACGLGMRSLAQAQENNAVDCFEQSAQAFLEALRIEQQGVEAFIGLTYWLILMGDELSAIHYARKAKQIDPESIEGVELVDLLESSHRLTGLMDDLDDLSEGAGIELEQSYETLSREEVHEIISQTELLLRIHNQLLNQEIKQGVFLTLEDLHSRQLSLEALHQFLKEHLGIFVNDPPSRKLLQQRLEVLSYDLESLGKLEFQFDEMRRVQKEIQIMFRDLTREIIRLRMKGKSILGESQTIMIRLELKRKALEKELNQFEPEPLKEQIIKNSGWEQLLQQLQQFKKMVHDLSPQKG